MRAVAGAKIRQPDPTTVMTEPHVLPGDRVVLEHKIRFTGAAGQVNRVPEQGVLLTFIFSRDKLQHMNV